MTDLYDTSEVIAITSIARPTFNRYVERGWISPEEAGGGRGKQNKFRVEATAWASGLREVFNFWPNANIAVYLFDRTLPDNDPKQWKGPLKLKNGSQIQNHIRAWRAATDEKLAIALFCGYYGMANTITTRRFAEIQVGPMTRFISGLTHWELSRALYTGLDRKGKSKTLASVSIINLHQLVMRAELGG